MGGGWREREREKEYHRDNDPIMQESSGSNGIPEKLDSERGISEIVLDLQNHRCSYLPAPPPHGLREDRTPDTFNHMDMFRVDVLFFLVC